MAAQHLCDRYAQAVAAVADFFAMYYGVDVAQSEDAQEDLVLFALGGRGTVRRGERGFSRRIRAAPDS